MQGILNESNSLTHCGGVGLIHTRYIRNSKAEGEARSLLDREIMSHSRGAQSTRQLTATAMVAACQLY